MDASRCPACQAIFEGDGAWKPIDPAAANTRVIEPTSSGLLYFGVLLLLAPPLLLAIGNLLHGQLGCTGGPDGVTACAAAPWAPPLVTALEVYCGWGIVFVSPIGAVITGIAWARK